MSHERVLVVDDEKLIRFTLRESLAEEGYIVHEASDVQDLSMTVNLSEDLLVIVDEDQPVRTDTALYVGDFSHFDPAAHGFTVLGWRHLQVMSDIVSACIWDCQAEPNGQVDISDFLALLAQWGQDNAPCDFDGDGVSVTDFLELLANFGPCPLAD